MEEAFQPIKPENAGLNIKELFFKYIRFLPLFIISVALALLVAYLYLRYATPVYRSTGTLVIQEAENGTQGDTKFQELFSSGGGKNIQSEIEYLRSRPLMERVVQALNLNTSYFGVGNIKELNIYKISPIALQVVQLRDSSKTFSLKFQFLDEYRFRIDEDPKVYMLGQTFETDAGTFKLLRTTVGAINKEYKITWQPTRAVASAYSTNLLIAPKASGTGILTLTLESTNPALAADIINRLMVEYQRAIVEDKNATTNQTLVFIDDRLQKISHELDSVTSRLLAYQQANNLIDFESQSTTYLSGVTETGKQIEAQRVQLELAQLVDVYLSDRKNDFNTTPSALGLTDPTLNTLIGAYNVQQLERKALIDGNVPRTNVKVQQLEAQIEKLRQSILENLRNIIATQRTALADLERKSSSLQAEIRSLPAKQQNLIEIRRQQESKLAVYNFLQEKREETAISLAATISNTKILEQASPNHNPVKPDPGTIKLLAIAIGLITPALFIFLLELLNDKVTARSDVEKLTATTILGEVGHSYVKEGLAVTPNNRGYVAEQFRIIRSNLQYVLHDVEKPVLLVTSSFSGEGKSFISTNFSSVMALAGKRTIVLEFDIRKPKILSLLNMAKKPGLTNYILGKASLLELPIPVEGHPNLFVMACGPVPPNPAELLLDEKLNDLFAYLHQQFDVIVIDTAPVGMVSDALTLSKFANATLYIVRQGYTFKKQIGLIDEFYQQQKMPRISIILNDVKVRAGYGYGRYGYGYGYGYGSNYFEDEAPPPTLLSNWFGWLDLKKWRGKKKKKIA
jgi:tyrosine-protein kinase Etk/Wzc